MKIKMIALALPLFLCSLESRSELGTALDYLNKNEKVIINHDLAALDHVNQHRVHVWDSFKDNIDESGSSIRDFFKKITETVMNFLANKKIGTVSSTQCDIARKGEGCDGL